VRDMIILDWDDKQLDILRRALAHYANRHPPEYRAAKAMLDEVNRTIQDDKTHSDFHL
jgi:hypothetical protein